MTFGFSEATRASKKHVIAERMCGSPWPRTGPQAAAIKQARADYEAGRVELAQRREGRLEFQYAIPRSTIGTQRPDYFNTKN